MTTRITQRTATEPSHTPLKLTPSQGLSSFGGCTVPLAGSTAWSALPMACASISCTPGPSVAYTSPTTLHGYDGVLNEPDTTANTTFSPLSRPISGPPESPLQGCASPSPKPR